MVKNEVLDVKKFADTAKNEAFQNLGIVTRSLGNVIELQQFANGAKNESFEPPKSNAHA